MGEMINKNSTTSQNPAFRIALTAITGVLIALFAYGAVVTLLQGHDAWGTTDEFSWGILISAYVFFAVGCTGICMLSTLGHRDWILKLVFGDTKFTNTAEFESMGIKPIVLAISFMLTAFSVLFFELKYPMNLAVYAVLSPNFQSAFIWMGFLYGIYLLFLILEVVFYLRKRPSALKITSFLAITTGIVASSNLGAVFGTMPGRAYWTAPYLPILFIFTALLTGAAALMVLYYFHSQKSREEIVPYMSKLLVLFIIVVGIMTVWNLVSGFIGQYPERYEATMNLLFGDLAISFWVFELGVGLLLPLAIVLLFPRSPNLLLGAAFMALLGMMFARHNLVTAGQTVLLQPDASTPVYIMSYMPTFLELSMVIGGVGLVTAFYFIITRSVARFEKTEDADQEKKAS
ncbi:NrfD/PsrC family molybdoenzyme membrane anchor subunit [Salisediminibacterium selenitireducens]|uniref:Polysulphide reductase NrfD n=1 Tax=Bacillus selenitireducens (strain ATCC 700615 / DSM 15326 / MLS10) TaxID=439292 RepID=D6XY97_BACIE|nr:NrfD/PsrC family molybdoenzyme membrane anchor subunit [Salisediminibacterium selenitireducens]ADH98170.1 Polysulphide reductase NrfD [[Bacillus] selenitireducens MLS10]